MTVVGDGLLLVDKPAGPTSHDVVARVRAAAGGMRTGHTGTLDPPATGLLVLLLGRATRLARFVPDAPKRYEGTLRFGVTTTTDDLAGEILARHDGPLPEFEAIEDAATRFLGAQAQVPPAVSARKVGGRRLYVRSHRGTIAVEAPPAAIEVARFTLAPTAEPAVASFAVEASTGTYVRALVRDLGRALGCGAAVASLRRTTIGPFEVADALPVPRDDRPDPQQIEEHRVATDAMPLAVPAIVLDDVRDTARFAAGTRLPRPAGAETPSGPVAVRDRAGRLLGIADLTGGTLAPRVVLAAVGPL